MTISQKLFTLIIVVLWLVIAVDLVHAYGWWALPLLLLITALYGLARHGMREDKRIFYGPHKCHYCEKTICKASVEQGGVEYEYPEGPIYPNTKWIRHYCYQQERYEDERRPSKRVKRGELIPPGTP